MEIKKHPINQYVDTIKLSSEEKKNTRFVAHRGASGLERENTFPAFVAAGQRSYFGVECDIHRTLDNEFIILHDSNFMRVAGVDKNVGDLTYAECASIPLFSYDGESSRPDIRTPKLEEYISILSHYGKYAVVELKDDFTNEELDRIVDISKKYDHLEKTVYITFLFDVAKRLRQRYPDLTIQFLDSYPKDDTTMEAHHEKLLNIVKDYDMDLDLHYKVITPEFIEKVHNLGHKVNSWTVDSKDMAIQFCSWGIDFITTNIIE